MASIDLASNSALLQVAEKLAEQNSLLSAVAVRGERSFVRYSAYADGTDFTEKWSVGQNYIGHAVGHEAPTEKEGYEWSLFASNIRETLTVTLPVSGWSKNTQTFETSIIGDGSTVLPTPTPECMEAYVAAGVMLTAATETSLIFTCAEIPTIDLVVEVYVTAPMAIVDGGVSSWNDLSDKPFGDVPVYICENSQDFIDGSVEADIKLVEGNTYIVLFDGVPYTCVAKEFDGYIMLGNNAIYGYDNAEESDTGEPFALEQENNAIYGYVAEDDENDHTVQILETKKIDSKYLPEVGVSSWNDLTDKPFYDESVSLGETATWDYVPNENTILVREETSESGELQQLYFHKVSTSLPAPEEFIGGSVSAEAMGQPQSIQIAENNIIQVSDKIFAIFELMFVVTEDNAEFTSELSSDGSIIFPTKGIYFGAMLADGAPMIAINSLTIPGYNFEMDVIKKLDPKFVHTPDWEAKAGEPGEILNKPFYDESVSFGETVTWDGTLDLNNDVFFMEQNNETMTASAYFHYISSSTPTMEELLTGSYTINDNGTDQTVVIADKGCSADDKGIIIDLADKAFVVVPSDNLSMSFGGDIEFVFPKKGIYVMWMEMTLHSNGTVHNGYLSSMTIPGYNFVMGAFKKLDSKFIPTPDWNVPAGAEGEILNRPFYDYTQEFGDTVTWDGQTIDDTALMGVLHCYSQSAPTIEELKTGTVVIAYDDGRDDEEVSLSDASVGEDAPGAYYIGIGSSGLYLITESGALAGGTFPAEHPGIYADSPTGIYSRWIKSITIPGHNFFKHYHKSIDSSFLPTTDWDAVEGQPGYIENRPFGNVIGTSDTLTWGVETGETSTAMGITWYHMCDWVPTAADLVGATLSVTAEGQTNELELAEANIIALSDTVFMTGDLTVFIALVDNASCTLTGLDFVFPKAGIYFAKFPGVLEVNYLRAPNHEFPSITIQTIDPKYLPDGIGYEKTTVTTEDVTVEWDGVVGERIVATGATMMEQPCNYVQISDKVIATKEDALAITGILIDGDNETHIEDVISEDSLTVGTKYINLNGSILISVFEDNTTVELPSINYSPEGVVVFPKKGVYSVSCAMDGMSLYISKLSFRATTTSTELKKIDPMYLPEGIGYDTRESFGDTINYDGSETAVSASASDMTFYKVSSATPTAEQLVGGSMAILDGDNGEIEIEIKEANIWVAENGKSIMLYGVQDLGEPDIPFATIAYESGATDILGITYSEPGVYMPSVKAYNIHTTKLYVPDFEFTTGELKKIDLKFLPEVESLPEVTAEDEGKVLSVVDGAWAAVPSVILISPNGTRYSLSVSDDGTLSAVAVAE